MSSSVKLQNPDFPGTVGRAVRRSSTGRPCQQWAPAIWNKGLRIKGLTRAYTDDLKVAEAERLYGPFWRDAKLEVIRPPIHSTNIGLFQKCPRKFLFATRLGLTRGQYEPALEIGLTTHELIAELYQGTAVENLPRIVAERVAKLREALIERADAAGLLPNGRTLAEELTRGEKDAQMTLAMVTIWNRYCPPAKLLEKYDLIAVEQQFAIKIKGINSPIVIKPDLVLRRKGTNKIWLPDHKTVGQSVKARASVLPFEVQPRLYAWVYQELLKAKGSDDVVGGWIHNLLKKCTLRYCPDGKDKAGGFDGYIARVHEWYKQQEELEPNDPPFCQSVISAPDPILDEELLIQVQQTSLAGNCWIDLARFHRCSHACYEYNKPCQYLPICTAHPRDWAGIIKANYVQRFRDREDESEEAQ